jgi:predicted CXXCH cytochrome family protein
MKMRIRMKEIVSVLNRTAKVTVTIICLAVFSYAGSIKNTRHNLSSASPMGGIKSNDTTMICIFCHTSHSSASQAPLWNREDSKVIYTLYDSSTLYSTPDQPDGASKLCLSCHDGTIALGKVINKEKEFIMADTSMGRIPHGQPSNLGSDLSDDHPISFNPSLAVNTSAELVHPLPADRVHYDINGKLQCTTCHDPHDNDFGNFLVKSELNGGLCKTCHQLTGYNGITSHDLSSKDVRGIPGPTWPDTRFTTVGDNSCMNCHRSHSAEGKERLLKALEEEVCLECHNGKVGQNIKSLLRKTSGHNIDFYRGIHDPTENILSVSVHVECVDCHNPHRLNNIPANAPNISGMLAGVSGMSITGSLKESALYEYEICLKCHGQDKYRVTTTIRRMIDTSNIRVAINPTNASFHAVAGQGKARWVPSLNPPYTLSTRLYCTDCHNSSNSTRTGGSGPNGPHGSNYEYILERQYLTTDYTHWTEANYALCYKCHNPFILFNNNLSGFEKHETHVKEADTPCSVCHEPHGSPNNVGLINFDTNVVFPNLEGELKFEVIGSTGYCYMQCHGQNHSPKEYKRK